VYNFHTNTSSKYSLTHFFLSLLNCLNIASIVVCLTGAGCARAGTLAAMNGMSVLFLLSLVPTSALLLALFSVSWARCAAVSRGST
jgi:hypothetical protein